MIASFEADGFCVVPNVVSEDAITSLVAVLDHANMARSKRKEEVFGARNLLNVPEIAALARAPSLIALVQPVL